MVNGYVIKYEVKYKQHWFRNIFTIFFIKRKYVLTKYRKEKKYIWEQTLENCSTNMSLIHYNS